MLEISACICAAGTSCLAAMLMACRCTVLLVVWTAALAGSGWPGRAAAAVTAAAAATGRAICAASDM